MPPNQKKDIRLESASAFFYLFKIATYEINKRLQLKASKTCELGS